MSTYIQFTLTHALRDKVPDSCTVTDTKLTYRMQVLFIYECICEHTMHTHEQAQPRANAREGRIQFDLTLTAEGGRAAGMEGWMECKAWSDGLGQMPVAVTWEKLDDLELMEINHRTRDSSVTRRHKRRDRRASNGDVNLTYMCLVQHHISRNRPKK